ncbi:hypothetical protein [Paenibacillus sp. 1P03SA]|uniref:hypothetical protein n=1 Tax=Paenibacillus sp. 1P03SA TaxID=3132294 RepID=UPI0039A1B881
MNNYRENTQYNFLFGTVGEGRELKTVKIWCEKEFGIEVPVELISDTHLYTHKEVWQLLDRIGIE